VWCELKEMTKKAYVISKIRVWETGTEKSEKRRDWEKNYEPARKKKSMNKRT